MEVQGTIYAIGPVQEVSEKFRKQEIILETLNGEYTQHIKIQFAQKKIDLLQTFAPGSEVVCQINIAGKLYKNKEGKESDFIFVCFYAVYTKKAVSFYTETAFLVFYMERIKDLFDALFSWIGELNT